MEVAALGLRVDANGVEKAAKSLEGLATQGEKAEKSFGSVERTAAKVQKSLESLARAGGDADQSVKKVGDGSVAAKASIDALGASADKAAQAEARLAEQAERAGMSVGAMKAALRGVPAQFTDIAVSLQGGMSPMTVFLQQGGQLKDMFNGAGNAAQALGGYVLGLINPFTLAAAAAAVLGAAYYQGSKELDALRLALVTTGNAAGVSVTQLRQLAAEMGAVTGSEARASAALASFVSAGVQGADTLKAYAQAAVDWEKTTGVSVEKTAKAFASLQDEPLKAAMKLQEGMAFLTTTTYEQARALEEQGKKSEAAELLQRQYAKALNQGSSEIRENLGTLERTWDKLGKTASLVWGLMLGAGRSATLADKLAGVREDIAGMERQLAQGAGFGNTGGGAATGRGTARLSQQDIQALQERIRLRYQELGAMEKEAQLDKDRAERQAKEKQQVKALDDWNERGLKYLSDKKKLERELNQERELGERAGLKEKDIQERLNSIREEYAKKNKGAAREHTKELAEQAKVYAELAGVSSTYYAELARGQRQLAKGNLTQAQYVKYVEDLIKKQPFAIALAKEEERAAAARQKAIEEDIRAFEKLGQQRESSIKSVQDYLRKLQQEEEAHALAAAAGISLAEAMERLTIARLQDHLAMARSGAESQATIDALERELAARQKLLGLIQTKDAREAYKKAAEDAAKDWEKVSQTISRTLSDYIMGGGKDAATYLKRLFANLVLEPVVQYGVQSVMGLLGIGQSGDALRQLVGGNSTGSAVLNNAGLLGAGMQAAWGLSAGASSASLLGANAVGMFGGDALGALIAGNGGWAGVAATGASAGVSAASSFLSSVSTAAPWLVGGAALLSLIGSFDDSGTPHAGAGAVYSDGKVRGGRYEYTYSRFNFADMNTYRDDVQDFVSPVAKGVGSALDAFAKAFGKQGGYTVSTAFADDSSSDGAWGAFRIEDALGNVLIDWDKNRANKWAPREFSDGQEGQKEYLTLIAQDVKSVFKQMDLPTWADQLLDAANDLDTLNAALAQIGAVKTVFDQLGQSMQVFEGISGDLQTQLLETSGSMDALVNNAGIYNQAFIPERERMDRLNGQVAKEMLDLGFAINPYSADSKDAFRHLVEEAKASGQGELLAKLMAMSGAFANAADYAAKAAEEAEKAAKAAADEAQKRARDAAIANFEAAVGREQEYWQKIVSDSQTAVQAISSILNPLKQSAKELFGTVEAAQQMQAAQGMVYIEQALAGVRRGAKLSEYGGLTDAITAARGGITSGRYASQFERDRDALVLANQLSQIAGYGDAQLSFEERQVKASQEQLERLDKTLAYWRDLLDDNKAQIDAMLSVAQAIQPLYALIPESKKPGTTTPATPSGGAVWGGTSGGGSASSNVKLDLDAGTRTYADGSVQRLTPDEIYWLRLQMGWQNLPSYDVGTNYVQRDQIAKIHQGEAIVPKAFNPWAGGGAMGGGNNNARLEALVAQLIDENRTQAGQIVRLQGVVAKLLQRWDGDGMPPVREEAIA